MLSDFDAKRGVGRAHPKNRGGAKSTGGAVGKQSHGEIEDLNQEVCA